jgi:hypothetical protein
MGKLWKIENMKIFLVEMVDHVDGIALAQDANLRRGCLLLGLNSRIS